MIQTQSQETFEIGAIAGMMDGYITEFEFRGVIVRSDDGGETFKVTTQDGRTLGGRYLRSAEQIQPIHDWLANKVELYEELA